MRGLPRAWIVGVLVSGLGGVVWANGGPFVIRYPEGDPAAKGVLARIDPSLKPAREERLRVLKEDLKILFLRDPMEERRPAVRVPVTTAPPGVVAAGPGPNAPTPRAPGMGEKMPLAAVSAIYTIENPTDGEIEVDFGFPILRGIYLHPFSMGPSVDVRVQLDGQHVQAQVISNSVIYGIIRQRAQETINKALTGDAELARRVAKVRATSQVRQRAREAVKQAMKDNPVLAEAIEKDASLARLMATASDAQDPEREAARKGLLDYLTGTMKWAREPAVLMVEYASIDLGGTTVQPRDRSEVPMWFYDPDMQRLPYTNMGRLAAIGEQKTTQLFAELAAKFDPSVKTAYEAIFTAWGGDVRERALDLKTGQLRPREITVDPNTPDHVLREVGTSDPTIYARVNYLDSNATLTEGERASCQAVLKNLPVVFTFAPMNLLHYRVKFPARSTKTLAVNYKQYAYADTREPASYQLAYVVHPASLWKEFGPIELEVAVPEGVTLRASVPCKEAGTEERALPEDFPRRSGSENKRKVVVHRGTLTEKTGELFVAVDAEGWKKTSGDMAQQPAAEATPRPRPAIPVPVVKQVLKK